MKWFEKFKNKANESQKNSELWIEKLDIDKGDWFQVFSACLGKMMTLQNACSEKVVKGQNWNVDFSKGIISFGNQDYQLQFIGSEAKRENTWLWGWENINGFSKEILELTENTKKIGENWKLEPLTTAEFELDDTFNGHNLSIVTCGIADKYCYYRGPHAGGAIFVAFSGVPESVFAKIDAIKFISIASQCLQQFDVNHKIFIEGFLLWNNIKYEWKDQRIIAYFPEEMKIEFEKVDDFLCIVSMNLKSYD